LSYQLEHINWTEMRPEDKRRATIDFPNDHDVLVRRKNYHRNYNPKNYTQYELLFLI
jgi:hypothetical protein